MEKKSKDDENSCEDSDVATTGIQMQDTEPVIGVRRIIRVGQKLIPVTMNLMVSGESFLGVRVVMFDVAACQENGFFLTVQQKDWVKEKEEKKPGKGRFEKLKKSWKWLDDYSLPDYLFTDDQGGYSILMGQLQFSENSLAYQTEFHGATTVSNLQTISKDQ